MKKRRCGKVLPVLLYHRIGPALPGSYEELTVDPRQFRRQIAWLKRRGYRTVTACDVLAWLTEGTPLPPRPVLLTFDDAYADLVDDAFPVLRENGFTAMVFAVTGEMGGSNSWDQKKGYAAVRCMGADQIRQWAALRMEFGAHTRTHADLTTLSASASEGEIAGSSGDLAAVLGVAPAAFAYPFGAYNPAVLRCAEKMFSLAFTCEAGVNRAGSDPHLLRRTSIRPGESLLEFGFRVKFGWNPLELLRERLRPRRRRNYPHV